MNNILDEYVGEIIFEEISSFFDLTTNKINYLGYKEGVMIPTNTTNLWVLRELSIYNFLGKETIMESTNTYSITDDFGMVIWSGDAESVIEYIKGFLE